MVQICKLQCYWSWVIEQNYLWCGKVTKSPPHLGGHFASAYLVGSNMLRAYLFFIYAHILLTFFLIIKGGEEEANSTSLFILIPMIVRKLKKLGYTLGRKYNFRNNNSCIKEYLLLLYFLMFLFEKYVKFCFLEESER